MPAGAAIGGAVIGGGLGLIGSSKQADAVSDAANAAAGVERWKTEQALAISQPVRDVNYQALNTLASMYIPGWGGMQLPSPGTQTTTTQRNNMFGRPSIFGRTSTTEQIPGEFLAAQDPSSIATLPWAQELIDRNNAQLMARAGRRGSLMGGNALSALLDNNATNINAMTIDPLFNLAGLSNGGMGAGVNALLANQNGNIAWNAGVGQANAIGAGYSSLNNAIQGGLDNWMTYRNTQAPVIPTQNSLSGGISGGWGNGAANYSQFGGFGTAAPRL